LLEPVDVVSAGASLFQKKNPAVDQTSWKPDQNKRRKPAPAVDREEDGKDGERGKEGADGDDKKVAIEPVGMPSRLVGGIRLRAGIRRHGLKSLRGYDGGAEAKGRVEGDHDRDRSGDQNASDDAHFPFRLTIANLPDPADYLDNAEYEGDGHDDAKGDAEALLELSCAGGLSKYGCGR
jgi:hypothetical protein